MNLFVVAWNCSAEGREAAVAAVEAMRDTYPLLDAASIGRWSGGRGFATWLHSGVEVARPRHYVHTTDVGLVLYDGVAIDPAGGVEAHDAAALATRFADLTDRLEGHFVVVRMDDRAGTLEVLNDPLGVHPAFVVQRGATWWISNSVRLLARAAGSSEIDLEGMAQCIGMWWPGGDRTLVASVEQVPAAQRWAWDGDGPPRRSTYWWAAPDQLPRKRSFGEREAAALADAMGAPLASLANTFGPLECPITAGRDSRMLVGLMMARDVQGRYFSDGGPDDPDVVRGSAIASRFGLPHRRNGGASAEIARDWDEVRRRVLRKNDGMVTLMHAPTALREPARIDRLRVHLYGGGGEMARGQRLTARLVLRPPSATAAVEHIARSLGSRSRLLLPDARDAVRAHIRRACDRLIERGFSPLDLPDAFDTFEYGRRWGGAQLRQIADRNDVFAPFFTRAYVEASFATPAAERLTERLPFLLLGHLSADLRAMPTASPWPPRSLTALVAKKVAMAPLDLVERAMRRIRPPRRALHPRNRERARLLESQLHDWRERHLDRRSSRLWSIVDRQRVEDLTSDRCTPDRRLPHLVDLFQMMTAFDYEEDLLDWVG